MPTLSIITINYNDREGFLRTAKSICEQSWDDFEWIVIDGGSTDGSEEVIMKYADRMSFCCSELDNGIYNAMNKGIRHATSKYLNFMNSGDTFQQKDTLMEVFSQQIPADADVIYGNYTDILINGSERPRIFLKPIDLCDLIHCPINHQSTFIRRELLADGYDESFKLLADWKAFLKWMAEGHNFFHVPVSVARFHMGGAHNNDEQLKKNEIQRLRKEAVPQHILTLCKELQQHRETITRFPELKKITNLFERSEIIRRIMKALTSIFSTIERTLHRHHN